MLDSKFLQALGGWEGYEVERVQWPQGDGRTVSIYLKPLVLRALRRVHAPGPAGLYLRLGRKHGPGRDQDRAPGPERGPAHSGAPDSRHPGRCRPCPGPARRARPFPPCWPFCRPSTKTSTHDCSDHDFPTPPHRQPQQEAAPLRVGIGGPIGSGKATLLEMLCKAMLAQ